MKVKLKKYLPFILLGVGLIVVLGAIFFTTRNKSEEKEKDGELALIDVGPDDRPVVSLTPRSDGHWLDMTVNKLGRFEAATMDYEVLYQVADGRTQGVPGTVRMESIEGNVFAIDILLGSESSGNYRYDEGVEDGTVTLRFRNGEGKLLAKFESEFKFQDGSEDLKSVDGSVTYILDEPSDDYFVVMDTIGYPDTPPGELEREPFGIFTSSDTDVPGTIRMDHLWIWQDAWIGVEDQKSPDVSVFVQTKS